MPDPAGPVAGPRSPLSMPRRSGRVVRASPKAATALTTSRKVSAKANQVHPRETRPVSIESEVEPTAETWQACSDGEAGRNTLQRVVELLERSCEELRELKEKAMEQTLAMAKQDELIRNLMDAAALRDTSIKELQEALCDVTVELTEMRVQLETFTAAASRVTEHSSPPATYAEVARTPPGSAPSNLRTISSGITLSSAVTDTLYCTVDGSRVATEDVSKVTAAGIRSMLEHEMRSEQQSPQWRCRAVTKDPKDASRVRVMCRNEEEQQTIKQLAEAKLPQGARVLRDDLHPIRVDNVLRNAVLDQDGAELPNVTEMLSEQNETHVTKVTWLSDRFLKQHGSIVVYLQKPSDARRFLADGFFRAGDLSGRTAPFKRSVRPNQCFNCQELTNHKAYQCKKPQMCGKCAEEGHHHSVCTATIPKCIPCGGPHESFSKNCEKLYPRRHE